MNASTVAGISVASLIEDFEEQIRKYEAHRNPVGYILLTVI